MGFVCTIPSYIAILGDKKRDTFFLSVLTQILGWYKGNWGNYVKLMCRFCCICVIMLCDFMVTVVIINFMQREELQRFHLILVLCTNAGSVMFAINMYIVCLF